MAGPNGEECEKCYFWDVGDELGYCQRHAPKPHPSYVINKILYPDIFKNQLNLTMGDESAGWPTTNADDWCGEFKPKPEAPVA